MPLNCPHHPHLYLAIQQPDNYNYGPDHVISSYNLPTISCSLHGEACISLTSSVRPCLKSKLFAKAFVALPVQLYLLLVDYLFTVYDPAKLALIFSVKSLVCPTSGALLRQLPLTIMPFRIYSLAHSFNINITFSMILCQFYFSENVYSRAVFLILCAFPEPCPLSGKS